MAGCTKRIFAVVVIAGFLVLTVRLCDIPVQAFATAWTFQDTRKDVRMVWIMYLFTLKSVRFPLCLCKHPIFFWNNRLMYPFIHWKLWLLDHVHLISRSQLLFGSASAVSNLSHINRIIQNIFYKGSWKSGNRTILPDFLFIFLYPWSFKYFATPLIPSLVWIYLS